LILFFLFFCTFADISDTERPITTPPPTSNPELDSRQQALNYSTLAAAAAANVPNGGQDSSLSSTETLLRNIQGLLKVAADNARQQERQISFEKGKRNMQRKKKILKCSVPSRASINRHRNTQNQNVKSQ
jgi:hypothetical protein